MKVVRMNFGGAMNPRAWLIIIATIIMGNASPCIAQDKYPVKVVDGVKSFPMPNMAPNDGYGDPLFLVRNINMRVDKDAVLLDFIFQNTTWALGTALIGELLGYAVIYDGGGNQIWAQTIKINGTTRDTHPPYSLRFSISPSQYDQARFAYFAFDVKAKRNH